ncbi:hypothetical protein [Gordonia jacobaea]
MLNISMQARPSVSLDASTMLARRGGFSLDIQTTLPRTAPGYAV